MKKISIITTLNHNVGDDFVREGIIRILGEALGQLKIEYIHKHLPMTVRKELAWIHSLNFDALFDRKREGLSLQYTEKLDRILPRIAGTDKALGADILVQSGAPIFWLNSSHDCSRNEWWIPIIKSRWQTIQPSRPFLNIAGGTCQPYSSDGKEFQHAHRTLNFIADMIDASALTTVRDDLSQKIASLAGRQVNRLPCTSIFAVDQLRIKPSEGKYVVLNYMPGGGHYDFENEISVKKWEECFRTFATDLHRNQPCLMVCHNRKEVDAARKIVPDIPRFFSERHYDYLEVFSKAKYGIVNRVHAAFGLASLGKPAAVIGADSRAKMVNQIGLESIFVNDVDIDWLKKISQKLSDSVDTYPEHMKMLKAENLERYVKLVKSAV